MMKAGAKEDMNAKTETGGRTPLHLSALGGKLAAADALIDAGWG